MGHRHRCDRQDLARRLHHPGPVPQPHRRRLPQRSGPRLAAAGSLLRTGHCRRRGIVATRRLDRCVVGHPRPRVRLGAQLLRLTRVRAAAGRADPRPARLLRCAHLPAHRRAGRVPHALVRRPDRDRLGGQFALTGCVTERTIRRRRHTRRRCPYRERRCRRLSTSDDWLCRMSESHATSGRTPGLNGYDAELRRHNEVLRLALGVELHDRVLDVGCGTGQTTREAARTAKAGSALGVDVSASAITAPGNSPERKDSATSPSTRPTHSSTAFRRTDSTWRSAGSARCSSIILSMRSPTSDGRYVRPDG